jgi:hypothetical protein
MSYTAISLIRPDVNVEKAKGNFARKHFQTSFELAKTGEKLCIS